MHRALIDDSTPVSRLRLVPGFCLVWVALLLGLACGAPESSPATGPIAAQIERALDSGTGTFDHQTWDDLLQGSVRDKRVDYRYLNEHRRELDLYLADLAAVDLGSLSPPHLEALLINAYNALTVRSILDHPGISSIKEIGGVWDTQLHVVGGHELTLDAIEHTLLRPFFKDPRIHFVVNCASSSCAPLPEWAFSGEHLEDQIESRARAFLEDPSNLRFADGTLHLSRYFDWYGGDFTAPGWAPRADSIPEFVARYSASLETALSELDSELDVRHMDYDWSLNSVTPE